MPSADEGDGELVDWAGFDACEPPSDAAEPEPEGASRQGSIHSRFIFI